jgi:2-keto-4-pentenoate hydratase/2-oxohepta-3-ene-1,7-dioic acid hydratase in catechol pathway
MKLLTFRTDDGLKLGIKTEQGILDIAKAAAGTISNTDLPQTIGQIIGRGDEALDVLTKLVNQFNISQSTDFNMDEKSLTLGPCMPDPGKIICVGLNYRKHAEESKMAVPKYPILFNKFANTIAAHGDVIDLPTNTNQVDYEAELVIVIGKSGKYIKRKEALNHVFGYCAGNDISARDLQMRTPQWLLGKSCDGFSPLGPYLVTADEVGNPNALNIRTYVNGEVRQNSNTSDMIFHCDEIVSYISQYMTLEPGDIILTGTPEGVIFGYPEDKQEWLKDGDEVTIEIEKLGRLTNRFIQESYKILSVEEQ